MAGDTTLGNLAFWTSVIFAAVGIQYTVAVISKVARESHARRMARVRRMHRG